MILKGNVRFAVKRLALGIVCILLASALLLVSDLGRRTGTLAASQTTGPRRVAVLQYSSTPPLEDGARGFRDALNELGFRNGGRIRLTWYNAEADMAIANAIATEMTNARFDLVATLGTPALQAVANANREGRVPHVFGMVAMPRTAGVGIGDKGPLDHPRHLVGVGIYVQVEQSFRLARRMFPRLRTIGIVWNSAESNSRVYTESARAACRDLGITVVEANVDNSNGVAESAASLVARGAEALWLGGDNTVMTALGSLVLAGQRGRVPVFGTITGIVEKGGLLSSGTNPYEHGREMGRLAAKVLHGIEPATLPVEELFVPYTEINMLALKGLKDSWHMPPDLLRQADTLIDEAGTHAKMRNVPTGVPAATTSGASVTATRLDVAQGR
jgi:putative tryptophan/tyrosine transport system substrate-binding protein